MSFKKSDLVRINQRFARQFDFSLDRPAIRFDGRLGSLGGAFQVCYAGFVWAVPSDPGYQKLVDFLDTMNISPVSPTAYDIRRIPGEFLDLLDSLEAEVMHLAVE